MLELMLLGDGGLVAKSYPTLCNPMHCSLPDSSVRGIFQARILEWLPFPSPRDLPNPGIKTTSPALADRFFTTESPGKPLYMHIVFYSLFWASLVYSTKESTCNVRENDNPLQDSHLENPHGQRSLVGYSPWGHKDSDTTEQLIAY